MQFNMIDFCSVTSKCYSDSFIIYPSISIDVKSLYQLFFLLFQIFELECSNTFKRECMTDIRLQ